MFFGAIQKRLCTMADVVFCLRFHLRVKSIANSFLGIRLHSLHWLFLLLTVGGIILYPEMAPIYVSYLLRYGSVYLVGGLDYVYGIDLIYCLGVLNRGMMHCNYGQRDGRNSGCIGWN